MKIAKRTKIWAVSLFLLVLTTQAAWHFLPHDWNRAFYFGLGAFWFGKLWGDLTIWIEKR